MKTKLAHVALAFALSAIPNVSSFAPEKTGPFFIAAQLTERTIECRAVKAAIWDVAVLTACGFSARKDLLAQLRALNQQVAEKFEKGSPVTAPGVPKNYPDAQKLVTVDCIKPSAPVGEAV